MKIAVAFCSMTWWASSELIISESKHFVAKGMSLYVQLLKAKGHFVARENSPYVKVVEGHFGKKWSSATSFYSPKLVNKNNFCNLQSWVTTSHLKFDGGCKQIFVQVSWITLGPTTGSGSGTVVGKCFQGSVRLVMKHMWTPMGFSDFKIQQS